MILLRARRWVAEGRLPAWRVLKTFNDQFGHILWEDEDRVRRLIPEEIPAKVAEDTAYPQRPEALRPAER